MYLQHFQLRELPFTITPNTAFVCATRAHRAALGGLLGALEGGEQFVKLTGEVGTGKTLTCLCLLEHLAERQCNAAWLPNPGLSPRNLLLSLAHELRLPAPNDIDEHALTMLLHQQIDALAVKGGRLVLLLDEAQAMPAAALEALRLLAQRRPAPTVALQVVLVGQPELDAKLAQPELRALAQRIGFAHTMGRLQPGEVAPYVRRRLALAGLGGAGRNALLAPAALKELQRRSRGTPRLVNVIAHKALLLAQAEGRTQVSAGHVRGAASQTPNAPNYVSGVTAGMRDWCAARLAPLRLGFSES